MGASHYVGKRPNTVGNHDFYFLNVHQNTITFLIKLHRDPQNQRPGYLMSSSISILCYLLIRWTWPPLKIIKNLFITF